MRGSISVGDVPHVLVLNLEYASRASYYDDWRDAFVSSKSLWCRVQNILDLSPKLLEHQIEECDAIVMLHSCNSDTLSYFAPLAPVLGQRRRAKLLSFSGNEYNSPYVSMPEKTRLFQEARCDVVATQLLLEAGQYLYGAANAKIVSIAHALNPEAFQPGPPHSARNVDIGVKGYRYPGYLGDEDRNCLISAFKATSARHGLAEDITEDQRLDRAQWAAFLGNCRATISTEAGSWFLEPNDARIKRIHDYLREHQSGFVIQDSSSLRMAARRLPSWFKSGLWKVLKHGPVKYEVLESFKVPFSDLESEFFRAADRAPVYGKAISSRHFDAIGTKTCQIMLKGRFNDILEADRHYIAVAPDFSNIDHAIERFKDDVARQRMVDEAYEHVMQAHTYEHRVARILKELGFD